MSQDLSQHDTPDLTLDAQTPGDAFEQRFEDLMSQINTLPAGERQQLQALAAETRRRHEKLRGAVDHLRGSLDNLRLGLKYLVFDLEATKRENKYLRDLLEESAD
jgi:hypothetical protein